jgi:hypothetical protein
MLEGLLRWKNRPDGFEIARRSPHCGRRFSASDELVPSLFFRDFLDLFLISSLRVAITGDLRRAAP